jgi:hypothetical protein
MDRLAAWLPSGTAGTAASAHRRDNQRMYEGFVDEGIVVAARPDLDGHVRGRWQNVVEEGAGLARAVRPLLGHGRPEVHDDRHAVAVRGSKDVAEPPDVLRVRQIDVGGPEVELGSAE